MVHSLDDVRPRVLLLGDTRSVGHHGSSSVVKIILDQLGQRGIDVISSPELSALASDPESLRVHSIDGVVINAEGALHDQSKHALRFARVVEACRGAELPCFVINAVLEKCDREVTNRLRKVSAMYCREGRSKALADSLGIPAQLCPDLTLALQIPDRLKWRRGPRGLVTDSTIAETNRALHKFAISQGFSYLPLRGAPQVTNYADRRAVSRAVKFAIRSRAGKIFRGHFQADRYGCAVATADQFLREISDHTKIVISGRFHGVCLCLKVGVPFLAVRSNTYKIEGMLEDAGFTERLFAVDALANYDGTAELLKDAENWSDADEQKRQTYIKFAESAINACFDNIAHSTKRSARR